MTENFTNFCVKFDSKSKTFFLFLLLIKNNKETSFKPPNWLLLEVRGLKKGVIENKVKILTVHSFHLCFLKIHYVLHKKIHTVQTENN